MSSRQSLIFAFITLSLWSSFALGDTLTQPAPFTLQVAAFPEQAGSAAEEFVATLTQAGEQPVWGLVEIPGKGLWLRVYVGAFFSPAAARQYAGTLLARRLIREFLVKKSSEMKSLSRPRSVAGKTAPTLPPGGALSASDANLSAILYVEKPLTPAGDSPVRPGLSSPVAPVNHYESSSASGGGQNLRPAIYQALQSVAIAHEHSYSNLSSVAAPRSAGRLPQSKATKFSAFELAPAVNLHSIPRADPLQIAFMILAHKASAAAATRGGLWISGDCREGLERLRWIVGQDYAAVISLDNDGKVQIDGALLVKAAKIKESDPLVAPLLLLDAIAANEGLLLLVQLTQGAFRYRLHLGQKVSTSGNEVVITGSLNIDNNYDSRINPYRQAHKKLAVERPPYGFDALIAINPEARWFNLPARRLVPVGNITFHELAEAYAKVGLGYEYLPKDGLPGAHNLAIEREISLQGQRPALEMVLTTGSNRMLKSEEELRQLYAETQGARQQ